MENNVKNEFKDLSSFITKCNNELIASINDFTNNINYEINILEKKFIKTLEDYNEFKKNTKIKYDNLLNINNNSINKSNEKINDFNKKIDISLRKKINDLNKHFEQESIILNQKYKEELNKYKIDKNYYDERKKTEQIFYEYKYGICYDLRKKYEDDLNQTLDSYNQELKILNNIYQLKNIELETPYNKEKTSIYDEYQKNIDIIDKNYSLEISVINQKIMEIKNDSIKKIKFYDQELENKLKLYKDSLSSLLKINLSDQEKVITNYSNSLNNIEKDLSIKKINLKKQELENKKNQNLSELNSKKELLIQLNNLKVDKEKKSIDYLKNLNTTSSEILILEEEKKALIARATKEYLKKKEEMIKDYLMQDLKKSHENTLEISKLEYEHQKRQLELNKEISIKEKEMKDIDNILNVRNYENLKNLNYKLYDLTIENILYEKEKYESFYNLKLSYVKKSNENQIKILENKYKNKKLTHNKINNIIIENNKFEEKKVKNQFKKDLIKLDIEKDHQIHLMSLEEINYIDHALQKPFNIYYKNTLKILNQFNNSLNNLSNSNNIELKKTISEFSNYLNSTYNELIIILNKEAYHQKNNYNKRITQLTKDKTLKKITNIKEIYNQDKEKIKNQINENNNKLNIIKNKTKEKNRDIVLLEQEIFELEKSFQNIKSEIINKTINYKRLINLKKKELKEYHLDIIYLKQEQEKIKNEIHKLNLKEKSIDKLYNKNLLKVEKNKNRSVKKYFIAIKKTEKILNIIKTKLKKYFDKINLILTNTNYSSNNLDKTKKNINKIIKIIKYQKIFFEKKNIVKHKIGYIVYNSTIKKQKLIVKREENKLNINTKKSKNNSNRIILNINKKYKKQIKNLELENIKLNLEKKLYDSKIENQEFKFSTIFKEEKWYNEYLNFKEKSKSIEENKNNLKNSIENKIAIYKDELLSDSETKLQNAKTSSFSKPIYPNLNELKNLNSIKIKNLSQDINAKIKKQEDIISKLKQEEKQQVLAFNHQQKQLKEQFKNKFHK